MDKKAYLIYGFTGDCDNPLELFAVADNLKDSLELKAACKNQYERSGTLEVKVNEVIE